MNTTGLKKFAQAARRQLMEQVGARLKIVLQTDSAELRGREKALAQLQEEITGSSENSVIEKVAYVWFNRFCALRFMDVNRYGKIGVVSPAEGFSQPEILQDAKQGHIDEELRVDRKQVLDLLSGQAQADDPQQEAYRLLLVAACNDYGRMMPFMFQQIRDYTELLMPDDLLSEKSILHEVRTTLTEETCQDVEVIGWLYQFYISEKKDQVFEGLKKNQKITPEDIPAATQLFTPHWIVRYLVENSLGRLWMLNRPHSKLVDKMEYYISSEQEEPEFIKIISPEEIRLCDPACGSGHILTYAFELLYLIYEEEGYEAKEIPQLILTRNLYGIEIDERAGELAAFALTMKARAKDRRFFKKSVQPNVCVLKKVKFADGELRHYIDAVGRDLFTMNLQTMLHQFEEADNFGSLIRPEYTDVAHIRQILDDKKIGSQVVFSHTHPRVLTVLEQAEYLSPKYHVVIANPPYMGGKGMNGRLGAWVKDNYPDSKSDLFAMFIERNLNLVQTRGMVAMITMQSWMFLSSFENLRAKLLRKNTLVSMAHLGARAFDSIGGEVVSTTAFVLENANIQEYEGSYLRLVENNSEAEKEAAIREAISNRDCGWFYTASTLDFKKIPGSPIAYWVNDKIRDVFAVEDQISAHVVARQGLGTGADAKYFRFFWEISSSKMAVDFTSAQEVWNARNLRWIPLNKGGSFRKWSGNREYVIGFDKKSRDELKELGNHLPSEDRYFKPFVTWSDITSATNSFRVFKKGYLFSNTGHCAFPKSEKEKWILLAYCNNRFVNKMTKILNPTIHFHVGYFNLLPNPSRLYSRSERITDLVKLLVATACKDWDAYETSWDFTNLPLLQSASRQASLKATYQKVRTHWQESTLEMQRLEEENNRIFIEAYGLQDELTPEVPLKEITLTCNPHYRYGGDKTEAELESLLMADTMKEFISYAVGCMFGRYSLDKPGLILANQGETIEDYLQQIPKPIFPADGDNVIPILDGDWFMDEIAGRFRTFLRQTFGAEHLDENLKFLEEAIGKDIRKYFLKDFYADHVQRYKKRPIFWLFSSPKGSFNALIYMHRYRPDTVSIILNDYLREFRTKLAARKEHLEQVSISASASKVEKIKALKEIGQLKQTIDELNTYENDILYPLATQNIEIDLDDGVAINYKKFGKALRTVPGLSL
ncbi:MAG: BREX-1 system adenine-specific DNA-methyltransferase PglX [Desulfocapsaceae bacterium]|nr:BREX-1 system adenine-specific DNA-methyltransferase PglX [Desulfocapsaceae bacterium]